MNGMGIQKWADGRIYEGEFVNGKSEGYGVYYYPDGREYQGNW